MGTSGKKENILVAQTPVEFLRAIFLERKTRHPLYSMRAFARDLGMSQALLSLVFNGKRPLTIRQASQIAILLGLPREVEEKFLESTFLLIPGNAKLAKKKPKLFVEYEVEQFKALSHWYHIALLDLATTKGFCADSGWIARRLRITRIEASDALDRLLKLGLLEKQGTRTIKAEKTLYFATQRSELAVRSFHRQMMEKASDELQKTDEQSFGARDISALTLAVPKSRIAEAKKKIKRFQEELAEFFSADDCDEVYQFNTQFFPLTHEEPT